MPTAKCDNCGALFPNAPVDGFTCGACGAVWVPPAVSRTEAELCAVCQGVHAAGRCTQCLRPICANHLVVNAELRGGTLYITLPGVPQQHRTDLQLPPSTREYQIVDGYHQRLSDTYEAAWAEGASRCVDCRARSGQAALDAITTRIADRTTSLRAQIVGATGIESLNAAIRSGGWEVTTPDEQLEVFLRLVSDRGIPATHGMATVLPKKRSSRVIGEITPVWRISEKEFVTDNGSVFRSFGKAPVFLGREHTVVASFGSSYRVRQYKSGAFPAYEWVDAVDVMAHGAPKATLNLDPNLPIWIPGPRTD